MRPRCIPVRAVPVAALIFINASAPLRSILTPVSQRHGGEGMPTDTIILVALIAACFGTFAATLAWAERRTRPLHKSIAAEKPS